MDYTKRLFEEREKALDELKKEYSKTKVGSARRKDTEFTQEQFLDMAFCAGWRTAFDSIYKNLQEQGIIKKATFSEEEIDTMIAEALGNTEETTDK